MSEELKKRLAIALTNGDCAKELINIIESLEARVKALEEAPAPTPPVES